MIARPFFGQPTGLRVFLPHYISHGWPITPGSKPNQQLNDQVISRKWSPSSRPASDASVSIINGLFRLNGTGEFIAGPATWGTSRYIETLVMSDADEYEAETSAIQFIGGVEYTFYAITIPDPTIITNWSDLTLWDDTNTWSEV